MRNIVDPKPRGGKPGLLTEVSQDLKTGKLVGKHGMDVGSGIRTCQVGCPAGNRCAKAVGKKALTLADVKQIVEVKYFPVTRLRPIRPLRKQNTRTRDAKLTWR